MNGKEYAQAAWLLGKIEGIATFGEMGEREAQEILDALEKIDAVVTGSWQRERSDNGDR